MLPLSPDDLYICQDELLGAAMTSLNLIPALLPGEGLEGSPERAFVSTGTPTWDCEQLTVHEPSIGSNPGIGARGSSGKAIGRTNQVMLMVTIIRPCAPAPTREGNRIVPPSAEALQAYARQISADGWALWNGIYSLLAQKLLWSSCDDVFWDGMTKVGPAGGFAGHRLTLRRTLDGFQAVFP